MLLSVAHSACTRDEIRSPSILPSQNYATSVAVNAGAAPAQAAAPLVGVLKKPKARPGSLVPKMAHLTADDLSQVPKYVVVLLRLCYASVLR